MKKTAKNRNTVLPGKIFPAIGMMLLLLFLTCINQFIYSDSAKKSVVTAWSTEDNHEEGQEGYPGNPAGPDEKSPNAPVSITEEYIHECVHPLNPLWINAFFQHKVHETEKLEVVHFELWSPPPEVA